MLPPVLPLPLRIGPLDEIRLSIERPGDRLDILAVRIRDRYDRLTEGEDMIRGDKKRRVTIIGSVALPPARETAPCLVYCPAGSWRDRLLGARPATWPLISATSTMHLTTTDVDHPGIPTSRIPSEAFPLVFIN